jgi:transposase
MKNRNEHFTTTAADDNATIFLATEMSGKSWLLGIHTPVEDKIGLHKFDAHDSASLLAKIWQIKNKVERKLGKQVKVMSVFEAGYDGFWYHRLLVDAGIENFVINPASLKVDRRARRAKTDSIDARGMVRALMAMARGEEQVFSVVEVPGIEQEDAKRTLRERKRLVKERCQHTNRIKGLLATQGIYDFRPLRRDRHGQLDALDLPDRLTREIGRQLKRLDLVLELITQVEKERDAVIADEDPANEMAVKTRQLGRLKGIGPEFSSILASELYYRKFESRRKLAGFVGLCSSPYNSGAMVRDQGISKAGPARIRQTAIELAWTWVRYQPESALAKWFKARVGEMKGRIRRINIVALARKLLIALWRYLETGLIPEGAILRS